MSALRPSVLDSLPPVVQLLLREMSPGRSLEDFYKRVDKLLPELRKQAEFSVSESIRTNAAQVRPPSAGQFVLNLTGALDPFSDTDKCAETTCRMSAAESIARFTALYADVAYVQDSLTARFAFSEEWNDDERQGVLTDIAILSHMLPLVEAGVLKFTMPAIPVCTGCLGELLRRIDAAAETTVRTHAQSISYRREGDNVVIDPEQFDYTGLVLRRPLSRNDKRRLRQGRSSVEALGRSAYQSRISRGVHETLLATNVALPLEATTLVGSRAGLLTIRAMGDSHILRTELNAWEASRAADLPWVRDLDVRQALELRDKAAKALPRFRARMATGLADHDANKPKKIQEILDGIREESIEVADELRALQFSRGEIARNVTGALALTISVYGFAAEFLPTAASLGTLMTALTLIHQNSLKAHQERDKLESRPGFVLLRAKEILGHAEHHRR
jgi:hypothetical protein